MGMCFGVRDALHVTSLVDQPSQMTIYGELVHNPEVNHRLAEAGFHQVSEDRRDAVIPTPIVLITAHGISHAERARLQASGKAILDTTCPLVRRVHDAALELQKEGRHVILIGKAGHVEVRGVIEDLHHYDVIGELGEVRTYPRYCRLGIVCQTTMPSDTVCEIHSQIERLNPSADIRFIDTVCRPTKLRQRAILNLLDRVEAVVVVGGRNSNNTLRLVEICRQREIPAFHVERAQELMSEWFEGLETVGLTAGTSTLDETIDDVQRALENFALIRQQVEGRHA
jgi:4-hydroxy-3-methylbut-2-enyl diphosphate reductase